MQQGLSSLFWFVAVVAAIPLVLWLLKRSGYAGAGAVAASQAGAPRTVATLALSPQQRLVTIEVGHGEHRTWLVLGVSPQSIATLHALPAAAPANVVAAASQAAPAAGFRTLLSRFRTGADHAQV